MNKHINKKSDKNYLKIIKKVQQRKSKETDRGCLKSVIMLIVLFFLIIFGIVACSTNVNFFFQ